MQAFSFLSDETLDARDAAQENCDRHAGSEDRQLIEQHGAHRMHGSAQGQVDPLQLLSAQIPQQINPEGLGAQEGQDPAGGRAVLQSAAQPASHHEQAGGLGRDGDLDPVIDPLITADQAARLQAAEARQED